MTDKVYHVIGFSGGIDSQAVCRWVLNRHPRESVLICNSNAGGNEHPITEDHVRWYSENVHPVIQTNAIVADMGGEAKGKRDEMRLQDSDPLTFPLLAKLKGRFPSSQRQFCTEYLKLRPQKRWAESLPSDYQIIRYTGVRREESERRKNTPIESWDRLFDCDLRNPIADWTKQMCFDYVTAHGEKINPLYTLGFNRVGCAPCINSSKDDVLAWVQRFPDMINKIREWEKRVGRTFFAPMVPGREINWVDEVVEWSKTARGGKPMDLLKMLPRPSCESKYGQCE